MNMKIASHEFALFQLATFVILSRGIRRHAIPNYTRLSPIYNKESNVVIF